MLKSSSAVIGPPLPGLDLYMFWSPSCIAGPVTCGKRGSILAMLKCFPYVGTGTQQRQHLFMPLYNTRSACRSNRFSICIIGNFAFYQGQAFT